MIRLIFLTDFTERFAYNLLKGILAYARSHEPWVVCRMPPSFKDAYGIEGVLKWAKTWHADAIIGQFSTEDNVDLGKYAMEDIALAYKEQGDTAQWVNTLQEGMQKYPDNSTFFAQLIDYYSSHNKYTEALRFTDDMLAKDPSNAFFWYVKGYVYHNMEQYDKAIEAYKKAIEVKPDYAEVYSNLGLVYCAQAQDYSNKATIDVNDPNYQKDQDTLIRAIAHLPESVELWLIGDGERRQQLEQLACDWRVDKRIRFGISRRFRAQSIIHRIFAQRMHIFRPVIGQHQATLIRQANRNQPVHIANFSLAPDRGRDARCD